MDKYKQYRSQCIQVPVLVGLCKCFSIELFYGKVLFKLTATFLPSSNTLIIFSTPELPEKLMDTMLELNIHFGKTSEYDSFIQDEIRTGQQRFYGDYGQQAGLQTKEYAIFLHLFQITK